MSEVVLGIPRSLERLLADLKDTLPLLLGRDFVGVYLYGSLTQKTFDARRSDADGIVVTSRPLSTEQFRAIGKWLRRTAEENHWAKRLQLTFLLKSALLTMNADACLYQFGRLSRSRSDANPIIWLNVLESGVVLVGPPASTFVPRITVRMLDEALARELDYLRAELTTKPRSKWRNKRSYRVYAVLTVCRILYSAERHAVVSKPVAARWTMKFLSPQFRTLVGGALRAHAGGSGRLPLADIRGFVEFAGAHLACDMRRLTSSPERGPRKRLR